VTGYVAYRGYRTWYRVVGDLESGRPPLLALHGGPGSTHHYFAPLERLADERPVVLYDQIGCGKSDRPTDVEWSVELFRDEVAAVRAHLRLDRIHLLGTSWGGMLALEHVLSGPDGIVSLVLSSTVADMQHWAAEQRRLRDRLPADIVATLDRLEAIGAYDDPEYERAEQVYRDRHFYRGPIGPNEWTPTGALQDWDVRERLGEIDIPTLVIRGRHDMCTDAIASTLMAGLPNAHELVLEESSHTPVLEETDRYLAAVRTFLADCDPPPPE
jgi:pimeloyl-ACP methyl ester carboxylesterase